MLRGAARLHRFTEARGCTAMSATAGVVKVTVYSDLACPWCYVGQQRLDAALDGMPAVAAHREWRAFLLDPHYPLPSGEPIQQALTRKFGPNGPALMQRIRDAGRDDGAAFGNWQWRSNTLKAHMLVALARRHGKSHEANQLLFRKSYEEGCNIGDAAVLLEVARALGLPEGRQRRRSGECWPRREGEVTVGGSLAHQIADECLQGGGAGCGAAAGGAGGRPKNESRAACHGVPHFIISAGDGGGSKQYVLSGAQPSEAFREAIQLALSEAAAAATGSGGAAGSGGGSKGACTREGCD